MRVVAGQLRGHQIKAPAGSDTRPTADRVREAIFAALFDVEDLSVLDLFAGSGALGIEALSRGADGAVFVERSRVALKALSANVEKLRLLERSTIFGGTASQFLRHTDSTVQFDLVFIDPPYADASQVGREIDPLLRPLLSSSARVVCESSTRNPIELDLKLSWQRSYGETLIRIYHVAN